MAWPSPSKPLITLTVEEVLARGTGPLSKGELVELGVFDLNIAG